MKESDLAKHIVAYLNELKWDVYQEVRVLWGHPIVDIYAVLGKLTWAIECKMTFGLDVIAQAEWWNRYAHFTSVAVPASKNSSRSRTLGKRICKKFGIGVIEFRPHHYNDGTGDVTELVGAKLVRPVKPYYPVEEQRAYAEAGNANSQFWTPFKQTVHNLKALLGKTPHMPFSDVIKILDHHYSTNAVCRSSLLHWIRAGHITGVSIEGKGKQLRVRLHD